MNTEQKTWSEEERQELASKLDKDLDEFISGLEKRSYTEGWPEDRWQEEMEKHPFFMKNVPSDNSEVSPLVQGLQQLKYSAEENTPEELAVAYKEDGNFNFKCKNYRMAIISYTEGLKQQFNDPELKSVLFNNRAASHYFLKNFRSCYNDCKMALKANPSYSKARARLAVSCYELGLYDECILNCDVILAGVEDAKQHDLASVKADAMKKKKQQERDKRKEYVMKRRGELEKEKLKKMIEERGIQFLKSPAWDESDNVLSQKVHIENNSLIWPVILLYPEYKTTDLIENFHEDSTFEEHLKEMFKTPPDWDVDRKYLPDNLVLYYEDSDGAIHVVKKSTTLRSTLSESFYRVDGHTPVFIVLPDNSPALVYFLRNYE